MTDSDNRRTDRTHRTDAAEDELGSGPPELGIGLDNEGTAGTGEHDTGTGLDYDFDERRVTDDEAPRES